MNIGDIWGAQDDKPQGNKEDAPTRALGSAYEEIMWNLRCADHFITQYVGKGSQDFIDKACHLLDITDSEYELVTRPDSYTYKRGIDLVRVSNIGRVAYKLHIGYDVSRYLKASFSARQDLGLSELVHTRLMKKEYRHFTVTELKEIWDEIPGLYRTMK